MKKEMKTKVMIAGAAFCAALFLFSGFMLCREYLDQKQSAEAFEEVAELVKEEPELPALELESEQEPVQEEVTAFDKYADVYAQNSDLVGWVSIPGTQIDYPVMQTKDNPDFYLKHAFDKSYSSYGVPYVQENCDIGISDNLVLYGHHMNNGSMFSDLCKYESEDFYQEHKIIHFDTLESFGEYEVIAAFKTVAYSEEGFILVPAQIHKLGIILVADVIFHGVGIQLVEQPLELFQSRVILPAGVHHKLKVHQSNIPEYFRVKRSAYPIGRLIAFYI